MVGSIRTNKWKYFEFTKRIFAAVLIIAITLTFVILTVTSTRLARGSEGILVKTDSGGSMLWSKTYGGTGGDYGFSVVQTSDGGFVVAGDTNSFGAGGFDFYLVKTDSGGTQLWRNTYGGTGSDYGAFVVQTSDGGFVVAGYTVLSDS